MGVSTIFPGFIRDAGMFADSGAKLPPFVGTKRPEDVARAAVLMAALPPHASLEELTLLPSGGVL